MTAGAERHLSRFNVISLTLGLAFLYLPIVILVIYSFNASRLVTVWGGWSLHWYREFFHDRAMLDAAWMSSRSSASSRSLYSRPNGGSVTTPWIELALRLASHSKQSSR